LGDKVEPGPVRVAGLSQNFGARYDTDMSKLPPRSKKAKPHVYVHKDATKLPNPWGDDLDRMTVTRYDMGKSTYPSDYQQAVDRTKRNTQKQIALAAMYGAGTENGLTYINETDQANYVHELLGKKPSILEFLNCQWNKSNIGAFFDEATLFKVRKDEASKSMKSPKTIHDELVDDLLANTRHKPKPKTEVRKFSSGKYQGMPFTEVPWDYLDWCVRSQHTNDIWRQNAKWAKEEMERRDKDDMNTPGESWKTYPGDTMDLVMTQFGENLESQFQVEYGDRGCTCFISPPCSHCTHEGNPLCLENSTDPKDGIWMDAMKAKKWEILNRVKTENGGRIVMSESKVMKDEYGSFTMPSSRQAGKSWAAKKMRDW
jgi:hypothetical protein